MNINNVEFSFGKIELAEDKKGKSKVARLKIPLMHVGMNNKNVYWIPEVLQEITAGFNGVVFKYDVDGQSGGGSAHVPEHLFSPHYDVGWTDNSMFDGQTLWVEGDVTHPRVIEKLSRETTTGKRELDAASMGIFLDYNKVKCSICGKMPFGSCNHKRGQMYNGQVCGIVPQLGSVTKKLHVALTNNPADTEAHIKDVLLQEEEKFFQENKENGDLKMANIEDEKKKKKPEGDKGLETAQENEDKKKEDNKDMKKTETAQDNGAKTVTCPKCGAKFGLESAQEIEGVPAPAAKEKKDTVPTENSAPKVGESNDETSKKNKAAIDKPEKIETSDMFAAKYKSRLVESIKTECARTGRGQVPEFASMDIQQLETVELVLRGIPPKINKKSVGNDFEGAGLDGYGKPGKNNQMIEVADMTADERHKKFGDYGKYAVIFDPKTAQRFER